jgi:3-oxoacyl-[acyl-carrier protein] reductase
MVAETVDRHGRIDVLVNNAGTTRFIAYPDLDALTDEVWDEILSVNLMGAFYCARAAAPALKRARGAIVNVTSIAGVRTGGSSLPYAVSKAALTQLTKGLAVALAPEVRVNSVAPGLVATRWHIGRIGEDGFAEQAKQAASATPLRQVAGPEHVAQAVLAFLQADLVTGESMIVDGGRYLGY